MSKHAKLSEISGACLSAALQVISHSSLFHGAISTTSQKVHVHAAPQLKHIGKSRWNLTAEWVTTFSMDGQSRLGHGVTYLNFNIFGDRAPNDLFKWNDSKWNKYLIFRWPKHSFGCQIFRSGFFEDLAARTDPERWMPFTNFH